MPEIKMLLDFTELLRCPFARSYILFASQTMSQLNREDRQVGPSVASVVDLP